MRKMRKTIILAFATAALAICATVTDLVRAYAEPPVAEVAGVGCEIRQGLAHLPGAGPRDCGLVGRGAALFL